MQKLRDVLSRCNSGDLSMIQTGELSAMSEQQSPRYRDRHEETAEERSLHPRSRKLSTPRVPADTIEETLELHRHSLPALQREAFSRAPAARSRFQFPLHLHQDAASCGRAVAPRKAAPLSPSQARAQAVRAVVAASVRSRLASLSNSSPLVLILSFVVASSSIYSSFLIVVVSHRLAFTLSFSRSSPTTLV